MGDHMTIDGKSGSYELFLNPHWACRASCPSGFRATASVVVVSVSGELEDGTPLFVAWDEEGVIDATADFDAAEVVLHGWVRWDGRSGFGFRMTEFDGLPEAGALFHLVYAAARSVMGRSEGDQMIEEFQPPGERDLAVVRRVLLAQKGEAK